MIAFLKLRHHRAFGNYRVTKYHGPRHHGCFISIEPVTNISHSNGVNYTANSLQYGNNIDKPINLYQARCEYCIMMIALTTLYQDRNKKLLPDVINQYLACYLVVCLLITACTSIDTMVPYINKWYIAQKNKNKNCVNEGWISQITDYQTPGCKVGCMTTYTKFIHLVEGSWLLENAADVLSSPAIAWSNISASKHVSEKN